MSKTKNKLFRNDSSNRFKGLESDLKALDYQIQGHAEWGGAMGALVPTLSLNNLKVPILTLINKQLY